MIEVSERYLTHIWKTQRGLGGHVTTTQGQALRVVYPGRSNGHGGPDFCDALMATENGGLLRGDVELHVRSSDWRSHGHHLNPTYNGVALHVVMWHDDSLPTAVASGGTVPVVALEGLLPAELREGREEAELRLAASWGEPCRPDAKVESLDALGEQRFALKAAQMEAEAVAYGGDEALYRGLMRALGYGRNEEPFQELACRLPWKALQGLGYDSEGEKRLLLLQAILLGTAGLLPSQRGLKGDQKNSGVAVPLEEAWAVYGTGEPMNLWQWSFFRVRPDNFPPRRIVAASHLVARCLANGPVDTLLASVTNSSPERAWRALRRVLIVDEGDYWSYHYDFGVAIRGGKKALVGTGRAREMVLNAVLPFACAWGGRTSRPELREAAMRTFRGLPCPEEYRLVGQMTQRIWGRRAPSLSSARRQQGLLHLHGFYCREGRCTECPLGVG